MSNINLLKDAKITRVANSAVAATTDVVGSILDMQGYDSVCFIALTGDATSGTVLTLKALENSANSLSVPTPVTDPDVATYTSLSASDADNKVLALDIQKPRNRYIWPVLSRATQSCVVDGILAIQYNSQNKPLLTQSGILAMASSNDPAGV